MIDVVIHRSMAAPDAARVARIDAALPQTQCQCCGYPRCLEYAQALARGDADIDQCPPGGDTTIRALARILGVAPKPVDPKFGAQAPRRRALIDEARCIGCRKCLDVCPVDAIVGANRLMHTVIAAECSGCELCLPPCPVDCIDMVPVHLTRGGQSWPEYADVEVKNWRARTQARLERLARPAAARKTRPAAKRGDPSGLRETPTPSQMRAEIAAAVARAKFKRRARRP